ncbi:pyridoxal kinase family protein [Tritrichomonas foetus]|uniref:pyridoxal kinase n=1 Tax=Tritrichomonas foetus TaxID=1144522 RepID=A0A1J4KIG1_9EUKA|nr:pyridoxal kinase family protein [Tritrichomonas foetus]|eukprot:OHT09093.1 pyridoxal kinase family protein [Tritrichomonas foetus]
MANRETEEPLVLSIQSQVVHGRSGNRSAVFALEINGIDCDPLNTVQLSTNTAYPHKRGTIMDLEQFNTVIEGLKLNEITPKFTHLLTGYIANPRIIEEIVNLRKSLSPDVHFLCDPVLGDMGKLYLSNECFEVMKKVLVPTATTICPNAYEAMWLTDLPMNNVHELLEVVKQLHLVGPQNVIISSTEWQLRCIFFSFDYGRVQYAIETPSFPRKFDGPGDLFSGLLLANLIKYPGQYAKVGQLTVNTVFAVLERTFETESRELAITRSVGDFLNPPERFKPISVEELLKCNINEPLARQ